ncbi:MAG: hypothetical protein U0Q12_20905 [Vicinamibacterales bacterium]
MAIGAKLSAHLEAALRKRLPDLEPEIVVTSRDASGGSTTYRLTAWRLVEVGSQAIPQLHVPLPVPIVIRAEADTLVEVEVEEPGAADIRQAQAFARDLVARGLVRGLPAATRSGPPARATHVATRTAGGQLVLRRLGFDGA